METQSQNDSPKYKSLMEFIDENPCWWDRCGLATILTPGKTTTISAGKSLNFTANGGDPSLKHIWNFDGAAASSNVEDPGNIIFHSPGTYNVKLTAINRHNESVTTTRTIIVEQDSIPSASIDSPVNLSNLEGPTIQFQATGSNGNGTLRYQWDFGKYAIPSTEKDPTVTFFRPGTHQVTLTAADRDGDKAVRTIAIEVNSGKEPINTLNSDSPLATNISASHFGSTEWPFVDLMKRSSDWIPQCEGCPWNTGESGLLDLDENGWVRSLPEKNDPNAQYRYVTKLLLLDTNRHYPAGEYTVLYDGEGEIQYVGNVTKVESKSTDGRHVINVRNSTSSGFQLKVVKTDPEKNGNYLRNIRILYPGGICNYDPFLYHADNTTCSGEDDTFLGFEQIYQNYPFHPEFLKDLKKYKVLRFAKFFRIEENMDTVEWLDRAKIENGNWSTNRGVPVEIAIQLANQLKADPWINIPVKATNDYVRQFATYAKSNLDESLKLYLEYAETIHKPTQVGRWIEQQALSDWPNQSGTYFEKRLSWYGKRTVEICQIWKEVWAERSDSILCVLAGNEAKPSQNEQILNCSHYAEDNNGQNCTQGIDLMAIAPWFGVYIGQERYLSQITGWLSDSDGGLDKLFQEINTGGLLYNPSTPEAERAPENGALRQSYDWVSQNLAIAQKYNLRLVSYAGGQHLAGEGTVLQDQGTAVRELFLKANRDIRMKTAYLSYLNEWKRLGGTLFTHALNVKQPSRSGSFGAKEFQGQSSDTFKFDGLMEFIDQSPRWW